MWTCRVVTRFLKVPSDPAQTVYKNTEGINWNVAHVMLGRAVSDIVSTLSSKNPYPQYAAIQIQHGSGEPWIDEVVVEIQRQHT